MRSALVICNGQGLIINAHAVGDVIHPGEPVRKHVGPGDGKAKAPVGHADRLQIKPLQDGTRLIARVPMGPHDGKTVAEADSVPESV